MNMKVLGFAWNGDVLPKALGAASVFDQIHTVSGQEFNGHIAAVTKMNKWWAGVLLKIRNAKSFTKMKKEKGVFVFSAEALKEGEQLAEANFFLAHESNGHGLYSYHHLSSPLISDFGSYCGRRFQELVTSTRDSALKKCDDPKAQKAIKKEFAGKLLVEQVVKPGGFAQRVKTLATISTLEANLVSFEMKERCFLPLTKFAKRSKVKIRFAANAPFGVISGAIEESMDLFENATVSGKDMTGLEQTYKMFKDAQVFESYDYDDSVRELELRFDDLDGSIKRSPVIAKMVILAQDPRVLKMLGIK